MGPPGAPVAGLPFGGIPSELQAGVDHLLADEPEHGEPDDVFSQQPSDDEGRQLTLWRLMIRYPRMLISAAGLIVVMSVTLQAGPLLTQITIDHGLTPPHQHFWVVVAAALAYLGATVLGALAQRRQVQVTGRLAAGVMNDLRVKIFTHLQRLSLDFFTEEKAGVIMTRMTSDIENLQQLLQDGLAQFAIQGLTMVVITVILLVLNVPAGLDHAGSRHPHPDGDVGVVPQPLGGGIRQGAGRHRQTSWPIWAESLHGVRIVTAPQPPTPQRRPSPQCRGGLP